MARRQHTALQPQVDNLRWWVVIGGYGLLNGKLVVNDAQEVRKGRR
jgi:hypothetical protein